MSARDDYLRWRQKAAVGCVFARLLAGRPNDFGQSVEEVSGSGTPAQVATKIADRVERLEADKRVSAATLVLPEITTLENLTRVALDLGTRPKWHVTTSLIENSPVGTLVAVHVVRDIAFGDGTCPSEALVLGPFDCFPATRRSPVTALEVYVGEPMQNDPKTGLPTNKANLAHVDLPSLTAAAIGRMWDRSMKGRLSSLGVEDSRAKARVSFVIPTSLAMQLGCSP